MRSCSPKLKNVVLNAELFSRVQKCNTKCRVVSLKFKNVVLNAELFSQVEKCGNKRRVVFHVQKCTIKCRVILSISKMQHSMQSCSSQVQK